MMLVKPNTMVGIQLDPGFTQVSNGLCQVDAGITIHYGRSSAGPELISGRS